MNPFLYFWGCYGFIDYNKKYFVKIVANIFNVFGGMFPKCIISWVILLAFFFWNEKFDTMYYMVFLKQIFVSTFMFSNAFKLGKFGSKRPSTSIKKNMAKRIEYNLKTQGSKLGTPSRILLRTCVGKNILNPTNIQGSNFLHPLLVFYASLPCKNLPCSTYIRSPYWMLKINYMIVHLII